MSKVQILVLALAVFTLAVLAHERSLQPSETLMGSKQDQASSKSPSSAMIDSMNKFRASQMSRDDIALFRESLSVIVASRTAAMEDRRNALQMLSEIEEQEKSAIDSEAVNWAYETLQKTASSPKSQTKSGVPQVNHLGQQLIFSDEFDTLNNAVWSHEVTMSGGGNWEFEYYTNNRTNSYVRDGILYLRPTLTADTLGQDALINGHTQDLWGDFKSVTSCTDPSFYGCSRMSNGANIINPIQSASVKSISSFSFKYGNLQVRAKLPKGDWIWPAIWLLPKSDVYGKWPASGEIDLVESRGNSNGYPQGVESFGSTLHYGPFYPLDSWQFAHNVSSLASGDFSDDFHTFGLLWTETSITTYLDDPSNIVLKLDMTNQNFWDLGKFPQTCANPWNTTSQSNMAPFDQEFFVKFNVAVGGTNTYFPDGVGGKPWSNQSPTAALDFWNAHGAWFPTWQGEKAAMQVDWVRVYQ
eukprot:c8685_g1_i1.p1 GENE.c8685_g1_i1~~c8685_g1_i1.p1  ORF type:complete len:492 (+),score=111.31 c8685_g1_i1:69-1478(+)